MIFSISFYLSYSMTKKDKVIIKPNAIPVPQEFVLNPSLQNLYANIEGKLIEKGEDYLILESNGKKVKLFMEFNGLTSFALLSSPSGTLDDHDLQIGDTLKGGISILISDNSGIGMSTQRKRGDIIAHRFMVKNR